MMAVSLLGILVAVQGLVSRRPVELTALCELRERGFASLSL
jgi:hypothetical protein